MEMEKRLVWDVFVLGVDRIIFSAKNTNKHKQIILDILTARMQGQKTLSIMMSDCSE